MVAHCIGRISKITQTSLLTTLQPSYGPQTAQPHLCGRHLSFFFGRTVNCLCPCQSWFSHPAPSIHHSWALLIPSSSLSQQSYILNRLLSPHSSILLRKQLACLSSPLPSLLTLSPSPPYLSFLLLAVFLSLLHLWPPKNIQVKVDKVKCCASNALPPGKGMS